MPTDHPPVERVAPGTPDPLADRVDRLRDLFPEAFREGELDPEALLELLGAAPDAGEPERYGLGWAGKRAAIRMLQAPGTGTLLPVREESVDFDAAPHALIEGENLEVLRLLYRSYFGRVKLVCTDPPYNKGKDYVYPDDFREPLRNYLEQTGQVDEEGNRTTSRLEKRGRIHSSWLSMMYPRLFLARQLLREDGVIIVSIDDDEVHNLRLLMNELFGEENFVAQLVWEKGRKNDAKLFSVGHEYLVVYARSLAALRAAGTVWREPKPGAQEIWTTYLRLREEHGEDDAAVEAALQRWFRGLPGDHPSRALSRYRRVDRHGPWRDRDISWPGGGGPRYDVVHPATGEPCRVPEAGWRFARPEEMERQIRLGLVVFREDHTQPPFRKAHLRPVPDGDAEGAVGMQVMPSCIYKQSQVTIRYLRELLGASVFDNPKDHEVLARLIRYCTDPGDLVLDFFAGSGSTGEAVLRLNREGGRREFILVQLPEPTPERSAARRAGYERISDITRARLRAAVARIREEAGDAAGPGEGFRFFRLVPSHLEPWTDTDDPGTDAYLERLSACTSLLREGWTAEGVIQEVALQEGYGLGCRVERVETGGRSTIHRVTDPRTGERFHLCLDARLDADELAPLGLTRDDLFVAREAALDDTTAANLSLQCRLKVL